MSDSGLGGLTEGLQFEDGAGISFGLPFGSAEQSALLARANELTALVSLYKPLGGGWQAADGKSS